MVAASCRGGLQSRPRVNADRLPTTGIPSRTSYVGQTPLALETSECIPRPHVPRQAHHTHFPCSNIARTSTDCGRLRLFQ